MKLIGCENGRLTLLVDLLEFAPVGGIYNIEVVAAIQERYGFLSVKPPTAEQNQIRFERGRAPDGKMISQFEIHQQGLIIESLHTNSVDLFLDDLLAEGVEQFGLRVPREMKRIYSSNLVTELEVDLAGLFVKQKALFSSFGTMLKKRYGIEEPPALSGMTIKPDPEKLTPRLAGLLSEFRIDRRVFVPYSTPRYYSLAPLPTDDHAALIERLEELAT
ncbi:MAG: hypothetical protein NW223_23120 [Hyphomicrobiaceae bacterium]|nr:hypothetical protein [Hyphomicrobiaceae bacterium]